MSLTRFLAVARKEIVQVLRDTRSLIIVLIMPVILVLLFGYGVNLDLKHLPIYVYDRDRKPAKPGPAQALSGQPLLCRRAGGQQLPGTYARH